MVSEERLISHPTLEAETQLLGQPDSDLADNDLADNAPPLASNEMPFRCDAFATTEKLALWFPRVKETNTCRMRWSKRSRALGLQFAIAGLVFVANLGLTIYALAHFGSRDGVGLLYAGDCDTVKQLDRWLHLLINVLSTGLLSASNYCMQLQAAPTRKELDEVHKRGDWMDIGILSLRNLRYIDNRRKVVYILLALSSVPIHLIYNSAVFQSLGSNSYTIAVVKDSFLQRAPFDLVVSEKNRAHDPGWDESRVNPPNDYNETITSMRESAIRGLYQELDVPDCFARYNDYFAPQGNALVFVQNRSVQSPAHDSLLIHVGIVPRSDNWAKNMWAIENGTSSFRAFGPPQSMCILNLFKAGILFYTWRTHGRRLNTQPSDASDTTGMDDQALSTLGDAIASFMRHPDETTKDRCLASSDHFIFRRSMWGRERNHHRIQDPCPERFKIQSRRWMYSVSLRRRAFTLSLCLLLLAVVMALLFISFTSLRYRSIRVSIPSFWDLGFGSLTPFTYLVIGLPRGDPEGLIANVLLANTPQFLLSLTYLSLNAMLSAFLVQREFALMHREDRRRPLRVSEPVGLQRSSYTISIPLRYGVPLLVASGLMHWLISQSLFLARIAALQDQHGTVNVRDSFSTCGYSPIAVLATVLAGLAQTVAVVLLGFRKYDGVMRMVSTNSRAISAACHVLEGDQGEGYLLPLRWGVVEQNEDGVGHCTFTTAPQEGPAVSGQGMRVPMEGKLYM
ncbi:P-loop containing nucleoside triphosphate hydrolase protein [Apiospora arundinis]